MENVLKQQVLDLRADRMSTHYLASNQLRLWLAAFAYRLLERLRTWGLAGTELAQATAGSVRLKLLKVAAQVRVSLRRVFKSSAQRSITLRFSFCLINSSATSRTVRAGCSVGFHGFCVSRSCCKSVGKQ